MLALRSDCEGASETWSRMCCWKDKGLKMRALGGSTTIMGRGGGGALVLVVAAAAGFMLERARVMLRAWSFLGLSRRTESRSLGSWKSVVRFTVLPNEEVLLVRRAWRALLPEPDSREESGWFDLRLWRIRW